MSGKKQQQTLLGFVSRESRPKRPKVNHENSSVRVFHDSAAGVGAHKCSSSEAPHESSPVAVVRDEGEVSDEKKLVNNDETCGSSTALFRNDIGYYISTGKRPDDSVIYKILTNHWRPEIDYQPPFSEHVKCGRTEKRYLKHTHLQSFPWVVFSQQDRGLYCLYCPHFAPELVANQKRIQLKHLVRKPLTNFAKLLGGKGDLHSHSNTYYHLSAKEKAKEFVKCYENPVYRVDNILDSQRMSQVAQNRARLSRIITAILYHGRQNLALRGHRDSGRVEITPDPSDIEGNHEGNFRETLRLMVDNGDTTLRSHLESSASNAMYTSGSVQNELMECIAQEIQQGILRKLGSGSPYSVIFDETTDLSHTNVMSFIIRYVHTVNHEVIIREDFLDFVDTYGTLSALDSEAGESSGLENTLTGRKLGSLVIDKMKHFGLDTQFCVGIGTDGCSVMTSESRGAVNTIREVATHAVRCHCYNHDLNLSLQKSSKSREARNTMSVVQATVSFFAQSAKRNQVLVRLIAGQLKALCATRWVERYEAILEFTENFPKIVSALEEIQSWRDSSSSSKAYLLLCGLKKFEFIVTLNTLEDLFSVTTPLSAALQNRNLDIPVANELMENTIKVLKAKREGAESSFAEIFASSVSVSVQLEIPQTIPRSAELQAHRSNYQRSTLEENYRVSVYIPLLDDIIHDLEERFTVVSNHVTRDLAALLPNVVINLSESDIEKLAQSLLCKYRVISPSPSKSHFVNEVRLWQQKWKHVHESPADVARCLDSADAEVYPSIHFFLKVFAAMPVSVASAERSFSTLKRVKTYLRNVMTEGRLTSIALMNIHRDHEVDIDSIVTRFGLKQNRRVNLIL